MNIHLQNPASNAPNHRCGFRFLRIPLIVRVSLLLCLGLLIIHGLGLTVPAYSQDGSPKPETSGNSAKSSSARGSTAKSSSKLSGPKILTELEDNLTKVIEATEKSVVAIARVSRNTLEDPTSPDFIPKQFATGVAIAEQGLILTCYHALGDPEDNDYYVWQNGVPFRVRRAEKVSSIVGADPWTDLAVLKIDSKLTPINLSKDFRPRRGQFVVSLGNPFGIAKDGQASASFGIISNLLRQRSLRSASELDGTGTEKFSQYGTLLQTDARLHRGTSGGPLLNLKGEMVGMITSLTAGNQFDSAAGFAIPVDQTFLRTVNKLREGKPAEFGFLGIATKELTLAQRQQFQKGVIVTQVVENTPADICGLKFGDIITHVNEKEISSSASMLRELSGRFADDKISVKVQRKPFPNSPYRKLDLEVQLGKKKIQSKQPPIGINDFSAWRGLKADYPTALADLGVHCSRIDPQGCVVIAGLDMTSPAYESGLREKDFVSHVNGKRVSNPKEFYDLVQAEKGTVELTLSNGKEKPPQTILVKAG